MSKKPRTTSMQMREYASLKLLSERPRQTMRNVELTQIATIDESSVGHVARGERRRSGRGRVLAEIRAARKKSIRSPTFLATVKAGLQSQAALVKGRASANDKRQGEARANAGFPLIGPTRFPAMGTT